MRRKPKYSILHEIARSTYAQISTIASSREHLIVSQGLCLIFLTASTTRWPQLPSLKYKVNHYKFFSTFPWLLISNGSVKYILFLRGYNNGLVQFYSFQLLLKWSPLFIFTPTCIHFENISTIDNICKMALLAALWTSTLLLNISMTF